MFLKQLDSEQFIDLLLMYVYTIMCFLKYFNNLV